MKKLVNVEDIMSDTDFIICVILEDDILKFAGQGLKWRSNPLHPRGWRKLTTAQSYAKGLANLPERMADWNVKEMRVCERQSSFRCLSSIAITKQESEGN